MHSRKPRKTIATISLGATLALLAGACSNGSGEPALGAETAREQDGAAAVPSQDRLDDAIGELDRIVTDAMDETGVPAVAVAVVSTDEVLHEQAWGVRDTRTGEPVDTDTVFQIASMSKPLSSTIVSALVDEGTIGWDDTLAQHGNPYALSDPWVSEHVTFADVFSHRSGLPGGPAGNDLEAVGVPREEVLERLRLVPLGPFREDFSYSNWAMTLGGEVAAIASGETWEELSQRLLFEPLGMDSTSMSHDDFVADDDRAEGHVLVEEEWVPDFQRNPDGQAPAGGVSSTVGDLAKWAQLQLGGGSFEGDQVVQAETLDLTHTPHVTKNPASGEVPADSYGLGWNIGTNPFGLLEWNHSGAFSTGAATAVKLIPSAGVGIVVLTNAAPIGVAEAIGDSFLDHLFADGDTEDWISLWGDRMGGLYGEPLELPGTPGEAPAHQLDAYAGTYANDYVGEVTVVVRDGSLVALMGPEAMEFPLTPLGGDDFEYLDSPEVPDHPALASFAFDGDAPEAGAVTFSGFDGAGLGTLSRT